MIKWENADEGDLRRLRACLRVCEHCPKLKEIFHADKPELIFLPECIRTLPYSSGEKILLAVMVDIWSGEGKAHLSDIIDRLDDKNFHAVIEGLEIARG